MYTNDAAEAIEAQVEAWRTTQAWNIRQDPEIAQTFALLCIAKELAALSAAQ